MQELEFTPRLGLTHVFGSAPYELSEGTALPYAFAVPDDCVCFLIVLWCVCFSNLDLVEKCELENWLRSHCLRTEAIQLLITIQS